MLFVLFVIVAGLVAPSFAFTSNITESCKNLTLTPSAYQGQLDQFEGTCTTNLTTQSTANTTLDLNLCVGINYTTYELIWSPYGKFSEQCPDCSRGKRAWELSCTCSDSGTETNSTLNLLEGIVNYNGELTCSVMVPS